MDNVGNYLKKKREEKGLSLESISKETKIQLHILTAIEAGDKIDLGGDAYRRIMLRTYARAIGIDESEIDSQAKCQDYKVEKCSTSEELYPQKFMFNKNLLLLILLIVVSVILTITVTSIYRNQTINFPFRKSGSVPDVETIITPADTTNDATHDNEISEQEETSMIIEEEPDEELVVATLDDEEEAIVAAPEKDTGFLQDRTNYLQELLAIDTDRLLPLLDKHSHISVFLSRND